MKKSSKPIESAYALAQERYAALGVNTDAVLKQLHGVPISLHCWQGDDVGGFEHFGNPLSGGIMATGSVIAIGGGHFVNVLDKSDGAPLFAFKDDDAIVWGLATIANGSLYVGDFDGNLFAFNLP